MSRSRTTERKRERQRQQRRQQLMTLGILAIAVVLLLVVFAIIANQPAEAPIPDAARTRYDGLQQSRTTEGYPRLGAINAPLQVAWYCNFDSLDCAAFHDEAIDELVARVRDGAIALTYVPLFGQIGNSQGAARAAMCAAEQNAFWPLHDAFYQWRQMYGEVQAFTNNRIVSGIAQLDINRARYDGCISSGAPDAVLQEAATDARGLVNFTTTPAVTVNGVVLVNDSNVQLTTASEILTALDEAIASRAAPAAPTEEAGMEQPEAAEAPEVTETPVEPTAEATAEA